MRSLKQNTIGILVAGTAVTVSVGPARADWDPGDPYKMHYPQLPDLTPTGMDVLASQEPNSPTGAVKILADDFLCTQTGPISDVHIWGSWLNDALPVNSAGTPDAGNVTFKLSIHADIPASTAGPSMPGTQLWSEVFTPGSFVSRLYSTLPAPGREQFYDPNINQIIGSDSQVWQYNFTNIPMPFTQQQGTIYWLDVQALPAPIPGALAPVFGWKTTNPSVTPHFNDDAVFADTAVFNGPLTNSWTSMVYPSGPYAGSSIDESFVIAPEPASIGLIVISALGLLLPRRRKPVNT